MLALIVLSYLILWLVGDHTAMRYGALYLSGILRIVSFLRGLAVDDTDPLPTRGLEARS